VHLPDQRSPPPGHRLTAVGDEPADLPGEVSDPADALRRLRRRRLIGLAMVLTGGLIVLAAAWLIVTGLLARNELRSVRTEVHQLRAQLTSGDLAAARRTLAELRSHAGRAHDLTTGPAWALAATLPAGGEPFETIRGLTSSVDSLASVTLPALIEARDKLAPSHLRTPDGTVNLAAIAGVGPPLARADAAMMHATHTITGLPRHTWLGQVDDARSELLADLDGVATSVRSADLAVHVIPPLLGADGPKRYFVAFQNDAEARGTGGLPGAFGILRVDSGKLHFVRFENDSRLGTVATGLDFGADYNQLYAAGDPTSLYVNSNLSPHFPYAARIWTAMWEKVSGQHLDGAIAVDPSALSYLLGATGPATLPDGTTVGADNVVSLTESTVYEKFANDVAGRKRYLLDIAKSVSRRVVDSVGSTSGLVDALRHAVDERRLLVWSGDPSVQSQLAQSTLGGVVPVTKAPFAEVSIVNDGGNKLDYYLDRSMKWVRTGCGTTRQVTATITLTNNAPASGLPAYVTSRSDEPGYPVKPGDNRLLVSYLATDGAQMQSVTVDGQAGTAGAGRLLGHPVYTSDLELPRGTTRTLVFHLTEPAGSGAPIVLDQPLVRPIAVSVDDAKCG
jgi:hypothetical protein